MVDLSDLWLRPTEGVERVSGRRKSLVKSLPTNVTESGSSVRWTIETYLELIEEFACSPEAFGTGGPARGETVERIRRAVGKKDGSAEERAIVDRMRVEVREYWQNFPKLQLLGGALSAGRPPEGGPRQSRQHRASFGRGGPPACQGTAGPRPGQGAADPDPGRGPVRREVGVRSLGENSGRRMATRTLPSHAARLHQALSVQPGLLRRSRTHMG